eukprot:SAG11_NODE_218_length_12212_cov_7.026005_7_plen_87_part_00
MHTNAVRRQTHAVESCKGRVDCTHASAKKEIDGKSGPTASAIVLTARQNAPPVQPSSLIIASSLASWQYWTLSSTLIARISYTCGL